MSLSVYAIRIRKPTCNDVSIGTPPARYRSAIVKYAMKVFMILVLAALFVSLYLLMSLYLLGIAPGWGPG